MKTTIDSAGRIVVPKPLREQLQLRGGDALEISAVDGRLEIEIPPTTVRLEDRGRGLVAVADQEPQTLTAAEVREALEQIRR